MSKTAELSVQVLDYYYNELKYDRLKIDTLKEVIKEQFFIEKAKSMEEFGEFDRLKIDGVILHEKRFTNYVWNDSFYEELINCGMAHMVLKHGDSLNKRFDLKPYELPKNPENQSLHFSPGSIQYEYISVLDAHEKKVKIEKESWTNTALNELIDQYVRTKMKLDIKERKYDIEKSELMQTMLEEKVHKMNGFSIKDEATAYDFSRLYNETLEEKVQIVTNGSKSIDLLNDKLIDLTEDDLYDTEILKKSIRKIERIQLFEEHLGKNYYFVMGYRKEEEIIKRFPISTGKVEEAIEEGYLNHKVLDVERMIESNDAIKLNFEIITEDSLNDRKFVWNEKIKERNLKISGYYDIKDEN